MIFHTYKWLILRPHQGLPENEENRGKINSSDLFLIRVKKNWMTHFVQRLFPTKGMSRNQKYIIITLQIIQLFTCYQLILRL